MSAPYNETTEHIIVIKFYGWQKRKSSV